MSGKYEIFTGTFQDAERNNLRDGIRMSTHAKIEFFEEMLDFVWQVGAIKPLKVEGEYPEVNGKSSSC